MRCSVTVDRHETIVRASAMQLHWTCFRYRCKSRVRGSNEHLVHGGRSVPVLYPIARKHFAKAMQNFKAQYRSMAASEYCGIRERRIPWLFEALVPGCRVANMAKRAKQFRSDQRSLCRIHAVQVLVGGAAKGNAGEDRRRSARRLVVVATLPIFSFFFLSQKRP